MTIDFEPNLLGTKLAFLMSIMGGREYSYQSARCFDKSSVTNPLIIIDNEYKKDSYSKEELQMLEESGNCLVLTHQVIDELDGITLFKGKKNKAFYLTININSHPYLKPFFQELLVAKLNDTYSSELLDVIITRFILSRIPFINSRYDNLDQKEAEALRDSQQLRRKKLKQFIDKNND